MRVLYERNLEHNNKVYVCFVDYELAFDREDWRKLTSVLLNIGVDWRDRRVIWNLYKCQITEGLSSTCLIGRGVRQGRSLSPLLYLTHDEAMVKEATYNIQLGESAEGQVCNIIRFA